MFGFIEQLLVILSLVAAGQLAEMLAFPQVVPLLQELRRQEVSSLLILSCRERQLVPSARYTSPLCQHGPNQHASHSL